MFGFAKKLGMTRLFVEGVNTPVTVLEFGTQYVVQRKTPEKDGYQAVQIGAKPKKRGNKPQTLHVQKHIGKALQFTFLEEFRDVDLSQDTITASDLKVEDLLDITGQVIGRGFAGAIKRHGFHGQPQTHGHDHVRAVGSIGSRWPQRTLPGKKMAGHMGANKQTIRNVQVVAVDPEKKLIFVRGSLPGSNSSYLKIRKTSK